MRGKIYWGMKIAFLLCSLLFIQPAKAQWRPTKRADYMLSPYTGYTRAHWLRITEKLIAGALTHFDQDGLPDFPVSPADPGYQQYMWKAPQESRKRALERIFMAVIIYTKATGNDFVPGYKGSISKPFIEAIIHGTDPDDKKYWGEPLHSDQVGSVFALAAYIQPEKYWDILSEKQKNNLLDYFKKQVYNTTYNNNHYFFHMVPVSLLEKSGYDSNRAHLTDMYERLFGWYRGNGWFLDGNNRTFDNYNLWGFQLFNQVLYRFDSKWRQQFGNRIKATTSEFLKTYPYLYGRDGAPVAWGRSLAYRFAGNSAIAWSVLNGMGTLPPGEARRIASGSLKYFMDHNCIEENGLLNIGYWGKNAAIAEAYLDYGDAYWAMQGLACLLIPANDPFWTATEKPIPADLKGGTAVLAGPQFVLKVSAIDGEARMYPVGQPLGRYRDQWQAGAKYDQQAYASYLGFCVDGEGGRDLGAGRTGYSYDGKTWFYRERAEPLMISENQLSSIYKLKGAAKDSTPYYNRDEIVTTTLLGKDGELHIFWHNAPDPIYLYLGGYGISVGDAGKPDIKDKHKDYQLNAGSFHSYISAVKAPQGKFEAAVLTPRQGWSNTHLFGGTGAYPFWRSTYPVPPNSPLIFYVNGTRNRQATLPDVVVEKHGNMLKIRFQGKWHNVAIPF